jgi:uncharacterized damage-inducible protein DinB
VNTFPTLAGFNKWANGRIYDCVAELPDAAYRQDRKAFFGSIHATLNHLLLVDQLWTGRIKETPVDINGLTDILHDDFQELASARKAEDMALIDLVAGMSEDDLQASIDYHSIAGTAGQNTVWMILATLFNHQTHHRGQVHTMLTQASITPPEMDVIYYAHEIGIS